MKAIILAGGLGTRLQALVPDEPKPMAIINGKPLLDYIIRWLKKYGVKEIIFCLHYKPESIEKYFKSGKKFNLKITYLR
jgi:NDP-sugar pyrophosphorylase family protein